ncbi:12247_t:CDS:1, partial [Racocetra fulgida]
IVMSGKPPKQTEINIPPGLPGAIAQIASEASTGSGKGQDDGKNGGGGKPEGPGVKPGGKPGGGVMLEQEKQLKKDLDF